MNNMTKKRTKSEDELARLKIGRAIEQVSKSILTLHDQKTLSDKDFCAIVDCLEIIFSKAEINYLFSSPRYPRYSKARMDKVWL